jgi:hypothetical protein
MLWIWEMSTKCLVRKPYATWGPIQKWKDNRKRVLRLVSSCPFTKLHVFTPQQTVILNPVSSLTVRDQQNHSTYQLLGPHVPVWTYHAFRSAPPLTVSQLFHVEGRRHDAMFWHLIALFDSSRIALLEWLRITAAWKQLIYTDAVCPRLGAEGGYSVNVGELPGCLRPQSFPSPPSQAGAGQWISRILCSPKFHYCED